MQSCFTLTWHVDEYIITNHSYLVYIFGVVFCWQFLFDLYNKEQTFSIDMQFIQPERFLFISVGFSFDVP